MRFERCHDRGGVSCGFEHYFVVGLQALSRLLQRVVLKHDSAAGSQVVVLQIGNLAKGSRDIQSDHSHCQSSFLWVEHVTVGACGQHDNYGIARAAKPGGPQGRPATIDPALLCMNAHTELVEGAALLLRPHEVSTCGIFDPGVLKVAHHPLG